MSGSAGRYFEPIRDSRAGVIGAMLLLHIERGRELTEASGVVSGAARYRAWRRRLHAWRARSARDLSRVFEGEAVLEFLRATAPRPGATRRWQPALDDDARRVDDGVELLATLLGSLRVKPGHPPRRGWGPRVEVSSSRADADGDGRGGAVLSALPPASAGLR